MEPERTPRERALELVKLLVPDWRPARDQALWTIRIVVVLGVLVIVGYPHGISLWDWFKVLLIPGAIAGVGVWFNGRQHGRELEIADQRAQDEALQTYLDHISQLLTDENRPLREERRGSSIRTAARARTLTVLARLDGERRGSVVRFLYEGGLIEGVPAVLLWDADLSGAYLRGARLLGARLDKTDLSGADLRGANLGGVDLNGADLGEADLSGAYLEGADLGGADLTDAKLVHAALGGAPHDVWRYGAMGGEEVRERLYMGKEFDYSRILGEAPDFDGANLAGADLSGASAGTPQLEALQKAKSLTGAVMPHGAKHL